MAEATTTSDDPKNWSDNALRRHAKRGQSEENGSASRGTSTGIDDS